MYITGHLNTIFPEEHRREILRYIYYHQVRIFSIFWYIIVIYPSKIEAFNGCDSRMKMVDGDYI